ncbi:hypothetical protein [Lentzea kentuckyensis]|uniref:hypothetical protein n=1 Tax=Lentzea kentuckyensis TaxID=360086 RepID=UPI000A35F052|nr:hypothetical protein [Lentzea kentuckyensis]
MWERVDQVGVLFTGLGGLSVVQGVELGDGGQVGLFLGFEVVVALAQSSTERVIGIAALGLAQDGVLSASDIGNAALQSLS